MGTAQPPRSTSLEVPRHAQLSQDWVPGQSEYGAYAFPDYLHVMVASHGADHL